MKRSPFELRAGLAITLMAVLLLSAQAVVAVDFDGNGRDDLLLHHLHSDDWRYYTLVDEVTVERTLGLETEPAWRFVATADFDGNGCDDVLLWRHDTPESAYHAVRADGVEGRPIRVIVNSLYDVLGAGDFDGDGMDDVLAGPRTRGHWIGYLINGTQRAALRRPRITQNLLFELQGFADITGDGKADPILRNVTTGEWICYATGNRVGTGQPIAMRLHRGLGMPRDGAWRVGSIGDYDGDGRATSLLRDPLTGDWRLHDIMGRTSDEVRFPDLTTELGWASVDALPQDNPAELAQVEFLQGRRCSGRTTGRGRSSDRYRGAVPRTGRSRTLIDLRS